MVQDIKDNGNESRFERSAKHEINLTVLFVGIGTIISLIVLLTAWVWWAAAQNERVVSFEVRLTALEHAVDRNSMGENAVSDRAARLEERIIELVTHQKETIDHLSKIEEFLYRSDHVHQ